MPVCFQLTKHGDPEPSSLQAIDEAICDHLQVPCDPVKWHADWYNVIGLWLACGKSYTEIRSLLHGWCNLDDPSLNQAGIQLLKVLRYLEDHYTPHSWHEHKS